MQKKTITAIFFNFTSGYILIFIKKLPKITNRSVLQNNGLFLYIIIKSSENRPNSAVLTSTVIHQMELYTTFTFAVLSVSKNYKKKQSL